MWLSSLLFLNVSWYSIMVQYLFTISSTGIEKYDFASFFFYSASVVLLWLTISLTFITTHHHFLTNLLGLGMKSISNSLVCPSPAEALGDGSSPKALGRLVSSPLKTQRFISVSESHYDHDHHTHHHHEVVPEPHFAPSNTSCEVYLGQTAELDCTVHDLTNESVSDMCFIYLPIHLFMNINVLLNLMHLFIYECYWILDFFLSICLYLYILSVEWFSDISLFIRSFLWIYDCILLCSLRHFLPSLDLNIVS